MGTYLVMMEEEEDERDDGGVLESLRKALEPWSLALVMGEEERKW